MTIQLQAKDDTLYYPETVVSEFGDAAPIVLCVYPAGDCDTIKASRPNMKNLRQAILDDIETGLIKDADVVLLPNGKPVLLGR